jgi:hypothetical protein
MTAKDMLNFNRLEDVWESVSSIYREPSYLDW